MKRILSIDGGFPQELPSLHPQTLGEPLDVCERDVLLSPLYCTHVGAVDTDMIREPFLREITRLTKTLNEQGGRAY